MPESTLQYCDISNLTCHPFSPSVSSSPSREGLSGWKCLADVCKSLVGIWWHHRDILRLFASASRTCGNQKMARAILKLGTILVFLVDGSVQQKNPLNDFCRRFGHQTAVVDQKLFIDGGQVNWNPIAQNNQNYTSKLLSLPPLLFSVAIFETDPR